MPVRSSKEVIDSIFGSLEEEGGPEEIENLESLTVEDVMKSRFVVLNPTATLREAINVFVEKDIEGAPVVRKGSLEGILTSEEIVSLFEEKALELSQHRHGKANYRKEFRVLGDTQVGELDLEEQTVFPSTTIFDAMTVIDESRLDMAVVVDQSGKVVGIVDDNSIIRTLLKALV